MKADEVLKRYKAGESNFCRVDLRGQSFKDEDLSGINLSEADIRGADFSNAILTEAKFTRAKTGLQTHTDLGQRIAALFMCFVLGVVSGLVGYFVALYWSVRNLTELNGGTFTPIPGLLALGIVIVLSIVIIREGLTAQAIRVAAAPTLSIAVISVVSFPFAKALAIAAVGAGVGGVAVAVVGSVPVAVVGRQAFAVAMTVAVSGATASTPVIKFAMETGARRLDGSPAFLVAIGVAVVVLSLSFYMAWYALKRDVKFGSIRQIKVGIHAIGGTSFRKADLTNADFTKATLINTDFRKAKVARTRWLHAEKTDEARWGDTILIDPDVRELLVTGHGRSGNYISRNLKGANLAGANLRNAKLSEADISGATLEGAHLEEADLTKTQTLGVNFHQAILTGACIEAWNIDSTTKLEGTICEHVYLKGDKQERRPHSGEFAPGEFTTLFQETLDTIDLIFKQGLDWKDFLIALKKVQVENEEIELTVESFEHKGDGFVVVRVKVPPDADKVKLHDELKQAYEEIKVLKATHHEKDEIIKILASRPMNEYISGDKYMDKVSKTYNFNAPVTGFAENVEGNQNIFASGQERTLAEAAQEIQQLLAQLQTQGYSSQDAQQKVANDFATQAQSNPTVKNKLMRWGQYLGDAAANGVVGDVAVEVIKLALKFSGIPLP